jgi:class 3 adenylate cyclase/tetratricopeptide (TPR) repeat protein
MQCSRCQHENPTGMKFCGECAAPLASTCSSCGAANPPEHRFCGQCAAPLRTTQTAKFAAPDSYTPKHLAEKILTSKSALEGERKQVTVLFADLKGSMELLADRDPEEARKLLDPVLEHMMEAVHRYEGTVNQVMGDGIMALFGAPLAHEDHAVRACYAALRMQETVRRYAEGVRRSEGLLVQIRVGLNSGEVVVRSIGSDLHMDYTAVGQTTHLAARMEQLAAPGTTLVSRDTLRLAEGYVQVKPLGPVNVKGLGEPVEVHELVGAGLARSRLQAAAARGLTRFIGREAELEQLHRAQARSDVGHGQVVAVVGEPGVGKSRLFPELEYTFKHALAHEVTYGTQLQERRRRLHARVVAAIERLHAGRITEHIERIAHHAVRGELWEKALPYLRQAGARATERLAFPEAADYLEQAVTAAARHPRPGEVLEQSIDLRVDLRVVLFNLGEFDQAVESYGRGLTLGGELRMRPLVAHCHLGLGKLYRRTGKQDQAWQHLITAATMYREMDMRFWLEQAEAAMRDLV